MPSIGEADNNRKVMIRDWYSVPAIPLETLSEVFGRRKPDLRVESVVLVFEFWVRSGATPSLTREKILEVAPNRINQDNIADLIKLLRKRGMADQFFHLMQWPVDKDGAFRRFLLTTGLSMDEVSYFMDWNGISPKLFADGFLLGMGESAATVVIGLYQCVKLLLKIQQTQVQTLALLTIDSEAGLQSLSQQFELVKQVIDNLVQQLDPTRLPSAVIGRLRKWYQEFREHLKNLESFAAGRQLGLIAGHLLQILTGIEALAKLLQVGARFALKYSPVLLGSIRTAAAEARMVIADLAAILSRLGRSVLDGLPTVGMGVLHTLFPPEVLVPLFKDGRAFLMHQQLSLFPVFQEAYGAAYSGARLSTPLGVVICSDGKPLFMAAISENLPPALWVPTKAEHLAVRAAIRETDELLKREIQLDELGKKLSERRKRPVLERVTEVEVKAATLKLAEQSLASLVRKKVQKTAYETFREWRRSKRKFYPNQFGTEVHIRLKGTIASDIAQVSPEAWVRTEKEVRTTIRELLAADASASPQELAWANATIDKTVASVLMRRPEALDFIGVEATAKARSEKAINSFLKKHYNLNQGATITTVGDLQSDLILAHPSAKRVINVDYTSSTKSDLFEKLWGKVGDDLGGQFDGDWDKLADAYKRAGKGEVPRKAELEELTRHAVRETVIRKVLLEEVLGPLWNVSSYEMLYDGLGKLYDALKKGKIPGL